MCVALVSSEREYGLIHKFEGIPLELPCGTVLLGRGRRSPLITLRKRLGGCICFESKAF